MTQIPVVVVFGATATGKTGLALELADAFDIEIISADSRYLYRGMNIGTAKPTDEELASVPHHLIDVVDPDEVFSLSEFLDAAKDLVPEIRLRRKLPVVVGGTPLYHRAFTEGWQVPRVPPNEELRAKLESESAESLRQQLTEIDPVSALRIELNNKRRAIRAIEVFEATGQPLSELEGKQTPPYDFLLIGLRQERDQLYQRIDQRVRWMYEHGILDEARQLLSVDTSLPSMSAIGYPEARAVVTGEIDIERAIELTCHATHRYVRHQDTWFRKFDQVQWLARSEPGAGMKSTKLIEDFLLQRAN